MKLNRVHITDFNSIQHGVVDFTRLPRFVLLDGRTNLSGFSSNGAGKSSVMSAICWCLFGKESPRSEPRSAASIIRKGAKSCRVSVTLLDRDGKKMVVTRSRLASGGSSLEVDGKPGGVSTGKQQEIETRLGMDYDLFVRTVMFAGSSGSFCALTPAKRMEIVESLLGLSDLERAAETCGEKLNEASAALDKATVAIEGLRNRRIDMKRAAKVAKTNLRQARRALRSHLAESEANEKQVTATIQRLEKEYRQLRDAKDEAGSLAEWQTRLTAAEKIADTLHAGWATANSNYAVLVGKKQEAVQRLEDARQNRHPPVCPTCGQRWHEEAKIDLSPLSEAVDAAKVKAREAASLRDATKEKYLEAKQRVADIQKDKPDTSHQVKVRAAKRAYEDAVSMRERMAGERLSTTKRWNSVVKQMRTQYENAVENLQKTKGRLKTVTASLAEVEARVNALTYWKTAFARNGIPSMLIEESIPALNQHVVPVANALMGNSIEVVFAAERSGAGRFDLKVKTIHRHGKEDHGDLSKGEAARADLCAMLAVRMLASQSKGIECEQVFIDELMDGMDAAGAEGVVSLIRQGKVAQQVIMISHDDRLQESADQVITVVNRNGVATVKA